MNSNGQHETSLSERTLSGLGWSYLSTFVKAFLSLLVLVILARLLTPVDFGLLGIAWIFIMLGNRFGQAFVGPAVIQRPDLTDAHIQVGFTLSVLIGIAIAAMIWLLAPFIGDFFREPIASQVLQVLSVIFIINGIGSVPTHLLRRDLRFRELMAADILAYCVGYGFTAIALALQGFGVWSLVWGEILHKVVHTMMVIGIHVFLFISAGRSRRQRISCPAGPDFRWPDHLSSSPGRAATLSSGAGWAPHRLVISRAPTS